MPGLLEVSLINPVISVIKRFIDLAATSFEMYKALNIKLIFTCTFKVLIVLAISRFFTLFCMFSIYS